MDRSLSGSVVMPPWRALGPVPSWGACCSAGYTDDGAWMASSVDNGSEGKLQCIQGGGPVVD